MSSGCGCVVFYPPLRKYKQVVGPRKDALVGMGWSVWEATAMLTR